MILKNNMESQNTETLIILISIARLTEYNKTKMHPNHFQ